MIASHSYGYRKERREGVRLPESHRGSTTRGPSAAAHHRVPTR